MELTEATSKPRRQVNKPSRIAERGAALFLVMMVITLLTAAGVFAMHSAGLATQAIGYNRQGTRAFYATEFAARTFAAAVAGTEDELMTRLETDTDCRSNQELRRRNETLALNSSPVPVHCLSMNEAELLQSLDQAGAVTSPAELLGKLNRADSLTAAIKVEMTDVYKAPIPIAGAQIGGPLEYRQFTLTATANIRPNAAADLTDDALMSAGAVQRLRAQGVFGPITP